MELRRDCCQVLVVVALVFCPRPRPHLHLYPYLYLHPYLQQGLLLQPTRRMVPGPQGLLLQGQLAGEGRCHPWANKSQ
jgi:hypothetical protein